MVQPMRAIKRSYVALWFKLIVVFVSCRCDFSDSFHIAPPIFTATLNRPASTLSTVPEDTNPLPSIVNKVAVAGATGRTGQFVVQELLNRGVKDVVAIVRDTKKASEVFPDIPSNLSIQSCDLGDFKQIDRIISDCDAVIWCATGFSDNPITNPLDKLKQLFGLAIPSSKISIDVVGLSAITKSLLKNQSSNNQNYPKLVMRSSAGVTRPTWDNAKKRKYQGAADIPIVRLNPFNILQRKYDSEMVVRNSGLSSYCIVRPCGLNDNFPVGSRPLFSQGDVAVGRNHRQDVAKVLVEVLTIPEACRKTFEMISIAGYPSGDTIQSSISRLKNDDEISMLSDETIYASYAIMQQLLPGEIQDSAALAMGQTYEQLDVGETGRLGERGKEDLSKVNLIPTNK